MRYPKPWKSYSEQLALLQSRGMTVNDTDRALDYLERIGYYRLSGYWFAFRERSGTCCPLSLQGTKPAKIREVELGWTSAFIGNAHAQARCFLLLKMTCHLLMVINPHSSWPQRMRDHLLAFPDLGHLDVNLAGMGAPENWQDIWNTRT